MHRYDNLSINELTDKLNSLISGHSETKNKIINACLSIIKNAEDLGVLTTAKSGCPRLYSIVRGDYKIKVSVELEENSDIYIHLIKADESIKVFSFFEGDLEVLRSGNWIDKLLKEGDDAQADIDYRNEQETRQSLITKIMDLESLEKENDHV